MMTAEFFFFHRESIPLKIRFIRTKAELGDPMDQPSLEGVYPKVWGCMDNKCQGWGND